MPTSAPLLAVAALFAWTSPLEDISPLEDVDATVWTAGTDGYHTYRIPAVIAAPNGDLLAFCEGRKRGRGDSGDIDLVMKRSSDGGKTWGEQRVLWDDGDHVCGNPCPVVDGKGRVQLLVTHNLGHDHESEIIAGKSEGTRTVWQMTSTDSGATWSEPREITSSAKRENWTWYATGPGIGIRLGVGDHAGRLVIPCDHIEAETKRYHSHVILSDDDGETWRIGGVSPRDQLNECQAAELGDGTVVVNMRNYDRAQKARAVMESKDGGESFGEVRWDLALPEPICQAGLCATRFGFWNHATPETRVWFSNPASTEGRERMTLKYSDDGGRWWHEATVLHEGPAAYSCLVPLGEHEGELRVGCLFEAGDQHAYERIVFAVRGAGRGDDPIFFEQLSAGSLDGWHATPGGTWTWENGVLVGKSPASEKRHGILVSDRSFGDFIARISFRVVSGDSGFYFRVEETGKAVAVAGFQAEIDTTYETGGLYETGGRGWVTKPDEEEAKLAYAPGEWTEMEVKAIGGTIEVRVNGQLLSKLEDDPGRRSGHLGLQLHGGQEMHVEYRSVRIKELGR